MSKLLNSSTQKEDLKPMKNQVMTKSLVSPLKLLILILTNIRMFSQEEKVHKEAPGRSVVGGDHKKMKTREPNA